jgi:hypothetical protein
MFVAEERKNVEWDKHSMLCLADEEVTRIEKRLSLQHFHTWITCKSDNGSRWKLTSPMQNTQIELTIKVYNWSGIFGHGFLGLSEYYIYGGVELY